MNFNDFPPALRLLTILCKPEWSEFDLAYINEHRSIDQSLLLQLANRHRVQPLLWLAHQKNQLFSDNYSITLESIVRENQIRALQSKALQARLLKMMQQKGIDGFFLKGTSIAERFYHDISGRHVLDLDLLVGEDKIKLISVELISMGFESSPDIFNFNPAQWEYFKKTHHDIYFSTSVYRNLPPIELHWRLRNSYGDFNLNPHGTVHPYDEFLYLSVHGTEHGWFRLKWLMDIPRIIGKSNFDWNDLRKRAIDLNCLKHLEITLLVLDRLLVFPLPDVLSSSINPDTYKHQLKYIITVMGSDSHFNETDRNRWNYFRYLWTFKKNNWDTSLVMNFLTSPNDWKTISLPSSLFFLYFLLRPFLWAYRRVR